MSNVRIQPRGDTLLVRKLPVQKKQTPGGIHLPEHLRHEFTRAEVVALGPGVWMECGRRAPMDDLEVGDIVLVRSDEIAPNGRAIRKHLIPVSPDEDLCIAGQQDVCAVEKTAAIAPCDSAFAATQVKKEG